MKHIRTQNSCSDSNEKESFSPPVSYIKYMWSLNITNIKLSVGKRNMYFETNTKTDVLYPVSIRRNEVKDHTNWRETRP